jgi:hypothetical protein
LTGYFYTAEFVWIMQKYRSCSREAIRKLIDTAKMKGHIKDRRKRIEELLSAWEDA